MASAFKHISEKSNHTKDIFTPQFFRLKSADDKKKLTALLDSGYVQLFDEIYDQVKELIKSRNPKSSFTATDYAVQIEKHLAGVAMDDYGVWVYYPWSNRVVHMLDEEEYIELRTAANKNKITIAERDLLATKKVGVIGLSVGQSVSLTLAMERGCGELRLADFDTLELNNLNRIRTGVHNLGLLKAHSVAREIAEIDPFLKVVCYTDGITEENIDDFFTKGGKLDAVIDECDGINIKILCRIKAKELHVPVLMEASDRGTLDVERFDLHPERPIMHGWLEHLTLDFNILKNLKTNDEKIPYMLPISGLDTLSSRMRASMIELRNTLTTWPQLATAVTLGGALTADTCRRIFLNQYTDSGRYFIDLETIVPDTRPKKTFEAEMQPALTEAEMNAACEEAITHLPKASFQISEADTRDLVAAALKAPSAGNSQPWRWHFCNGYLFLFREDTNIVSFGDCGHIASYVALGAALENVEQQARKNGIGTKLHLFPLRTNNRLVAAVQFGNVGSPVAANGNLADYIGTRTTNRNAGSGERINDTVLAMLREVVASVPGAALEIKETEKDKGELADIIGPVDRLRLLNPASHYEFFEKEIHWENDGAPVGVNIKSLCLSQGEEIALKMIRKQDVARLLADWSGGQALEYTARKGVATASAIGAISMPEATATSYIKGGMAMQKMWLAATANGLAVQPVMAPLLFFARLKNSTDGSTPGFMKEELQDLHKKFEHIFSDIKNREIVFLFRLAITDIRPAPSERKAIGTVLSFQK